MHNKDLNHFPEPKKMGEYIKREYALKRFEQLKEEAETIQEKLYLDGILAVIETLPVANVRENVRGKWDDSLDGITPYCSVCGCTHNCLTRKPLYCPHCGADMRDKDA